MNDRLQEIALRIYTAMLANPYLAEKLSGNNGLLANDITAYAIDMAHNFIAAAGEGQPISYSEELPMGTKPCPMCHGTRVIIQEMSISEIPNNSKSIEIIDSILCNLTDDDGYPYFAPSSYNITRACELLNELRGTPITNPNNSEPIKSELSDYQKALNLVNEMPRFHLGQEVITPNGKGIIVRLKMQYNGLYIEPETSYAVVWFSTDRAASDGTEWVNRSYSLSELTT